MVIRTKIMVVAIISLIFTISFARPQQEPMSKIPENQRESLRIRLDAYVKAYQARNWGKLYDLVSDTGRGGATRGNFINAMKAQHGMEFANMPDLLEFYPDHAEAGVVGGFDIYGCGKARREGQMYDGIAVTHAVFEHDNWYFTGWRFTAFPNRSCKELSNPSWKPMNRLKWDLPMEEVRQAR
jgi:hypothetical protein